MNKFNPGDLVCFEWVKKRKDIKRVFMVLKNNDDDTRGTMKIVEIISNCSYYLLHIWNHENKQSFRKIDD